MNFVCVCGPGEKFIYYSCSLIYGCRMSMHATFFLLPLQRSAVGGPMLSESDFPLHGHRIRPPQPTPLNTPPRLMRWHYLQCIIRRFSRSEYRNIQNISYDELSLEMEEPSEDGCANSLTGCRLLWTACEQLKRRSMKSISGCLELRAGCLSVL